MARCFCHLHLHTHYSLLDGFNRIPPLVEQTKKLGMNACAITDHGNLYGAIEFYNECKKGGDQADHRLRGVSRPEPRPERDAKHELGDATHLTLLAKNNTGFKNLIKLSSASRILEGFYRNPRIDREVLEAHSEGLICLSGCLAGEFNQYILKDKPEEAEKLAKWFRKLFGEDFYIEIQNNGIALAGSVHAGRGGHREQARRAARGHRRRPLPVLGGRRAPTTCSSASTPQQEARPEEEEVSRRADAEPVLRPQPGGHVPAVSRTSRTRSRAARKSPTASTSTSTSRSGTSRSSHRRRRKRRTSTSANCANRA